MSFPESHLAQEAIAALVDGELPSGPAGRAARHLRTCLMCRMAVAAQREAKEALHRSADVDVPGDLLDRLRAIPFTTEVPGTGGPGSLTGSGDQLTVSGARGAFSFSLAPQPPVAPRADQARWLRRGVLGTVAVLGAGVTALALSLPAASAPSGTGSSAGRSGADEHTSIVPPVVRTVTVGTTSSLPGLAVGGTPAGGTP